MQIVKASREELLRPLQVVTGIVDRRNTMPILANVLLRKAGDQVSFLTTDTEIQMTTSGVFGVGADDVSTTVAARKLLDILKSLGEGASVSLAMTNKKMTVQSGKSKFVVQSIDASGYPVMGVQDEFGVSFDVSKRKLKNLLNMVHFSMAQNDIRYYLNGLLLEIDGNAVVAVATDGHRLALCRMDTEVEMSNQQVIIPRKTVMELMRLLDDSDEPVNVALSTSQAKFTFDDIEIITKLVEGKFPSYDRVIPKGHPNEFAIERTELLSSLQRAAIMTGDKNRGISCQIEPGMVQIRAANSEQEEGLEQLTIDYGGESVVIGMNVNYLVDFLSNVKCTQVNFAFADENTSVLLTMVGDDSVQYVVMPMRI